MCRRRARCPACRRWSTSWSRARSKKIPRCATRTLASSPRILPPASPSCAAVNTGGAAAGSLARGKIEALTLEGNKAHAGGHRRVVMPVNAPRTRQKRAAHDVPHDELARLGARLFHQLLVRHLRQRLGILLQAIEEHLVEALVHAAEAPALELVRHAARAHDHDFQLSRITFDR